MQGSPTFLTGPTGLALLATATQAEARVAIGSPAFAGDDTATVTTSSVVRSQVDSSGNVSSTIPGGSVLLPEFKCRAWINFDGTTTPPTIRASGNISSLTRNSTGDFTVNFATAMPDTNYCACAGITWATQTGVIRNDGGTNVQAGSYRFLVIGTALYNSAITMLSFFR